MGKRRVGRSRASVRPSRGGEHGDLRGERPTTATIDLGALAHNFALAGRLAGGRHVVAVVKADAYGHGAVPVARRLVEAGCRHLAVVTVAEGVVLREAGLRVPILVMGGVHDAEEAAAVAHHGLTAVVHHAGHLPLLAKAAREREEPLPVHVEVDTGMRRMGVAPEDAPELLAGLARAPGLVLDGIYTHLAQADEADPAPTRAQLGLFREVLAAAATRGAVARQVHVANSGGVIAAESFAEELPPEVNAVRPGLMLYGAAPSRHLFGRAPLAPVMSLRTRVCHVRHVRPGDPVGYGATFRAGQRGRVATIPVGYADGIPWCLGNRGSAILRGRRVRFAGRVSMDLVTLDVGEGPVEIGDEVLLFGRGAGDPPARLPVEEVAEAAGTIAYEILTGVGARVPRLVEA